MSRRMQGRASLPARRARARDARWAAPAPVPAGIPVLPDHGLGEATRAFLDSLRVLLAAAAGDGGAPGGGGTTLQQPGGVPEDMDRVAALVELAQGGDAEAFGLLYERYVDLVYRYIYVRVGSRHLAEDLTSETFVRALRRIDSFSWQGRDIAAWFVTIARNLITDHAKSARFRLEVSTADMLDADRRVEAPEAEVLQHLRDTRLLEAVRDLKPEQAECVVLRFLQGLSLAETAAVIGKSEGAVKQLQLRAVRALHRALDGEVL
ncbi:sigma-70 family RNA polymerase sigma factor [Oryzihumus sp.]|uniref:sigma-70 family RNA polymerase sigma factor n=1 Tax=Oryzihumus sp. TaxID=1968903 RepID=UPI002EDA1CD7